MDIGKHTIFIAKSNRLAFYMHLGCESLVFNKLKITLPRTWIPRQGVFQILIKMTSVALGRRGEAEGSPARGTIRTIRPHAPVNDLVLGQVRRRREVRDTHILVHQERPKLRVDRDLDRVTRRTEYILPIE